MISIDEFVDSLYKGINGNEKEIKDFKEEMKEHLIETVNELKSEGNTEEESLKIAYERFGDVKVINNGLFKLFNKQKKFIRFILIFAVTFLLIGVSSYIFMSQRDLKFQKEQKILTKGILETLGNNDNITEENKSKIKELAKKYDYINYIALFKISDNPKMKREIEEDKELNINGIYIYPFDIKMAKVMYPNNAKQLTKQDGYDRSTVAATNKKWVIQYEYKNFIHSYIENYSSRIVYSNLDYSTATFNYKNSIYLIIIGGTLLILWIILRLYNRVNLKLVK
ncbi:permease prefix domain 1-containing protein [Clostridium sp. L74]|uniref:permease prefix domain 1-containing protein n=1 Tax=Clostridium sp. L74 TaxID=1560217 RepID=UPI0006ABB675|nr:permease prefix domain 1-containing protein [Clostridium sp. L74]KOR26125.1 hypothetical protein ND00_09830 [Clostridium sp. L74]